LDIDQMEKNILDIIEFSKTYNVAYRPHIKTHKSINIAKKQIEFGAVGVTVAKVGEAEVMVHGGIKDVLIAYPIATAKKLVRVKKLMEHASITIAVDSIEQATILRELFKDQDRKSTRLNSSHVSISYDVSCLQKKEMTDTRQTL